IAAAGHEELLDRLVVGGLFEGRLRRRRRHRLLAQRPAARLRAQMRRRPVSVSTGSTASMEGMSAARLSASPPVATARAGSPSSVRMRLMMPSTIDEYPK